MNFRPFFRNEKQPVKNEKFYTNYVNVDFPENIFTHSSDTINEVILYANTYTHCFPLLSANYQFSKVRALSLS